jgi:hypothetical protein
MKGEQFTIKHCVKDVEIRIYAYFNHIKIKGILKNFLLSIKRRAKWLS